MKAIICFSTIVLFTLFTLDENQLSQVNLGANETLNRSLSFSSIWEETKKIDFSEVIQEFNANLLPVVNVYLLNEAVPLTER